ncbi:2-polyprenyl-3-methyl-5-hydroxy-6-metoxy-1,4-benzoquinol methylase [Pontibacter aydingkolensis]|uniref:Class I SAM-dependent methyltransferase n=1 Tax=Pontibacter aydingkolensis TaxID=1911536 RepID=A0ABS7CVW1_9BACT|nr:class I SAM-dependent methyltransferase [Pontibacter aydingkolensis]MBW7467989.1 class I SAM-dependent methyltransferase [Pontibacter aydingkolensis]
MQNFWNERYGKQEMIYGSEPNDFFREQLSKLTPGKLLLPAEGEGRNAVYAAQQRWDVLAFDYSDAGRAKAMQLAAQKGVNINYEVADAQTFSATPESLDAVALIYAHMPPTARTTLHQNIMTWLKPGGKLIVEAFHLKQLEGYPSGGPKNEDMLYTAATLIEDFKGMQVEYVKEEEIELAEGTYHLGKGYVTRLVASKP